MLFDQHLSAAIQKYPNLSIVGRPGHRYLKGILDVPDETGEIVTSYSVEIKCSQGYPMRFPEAFEVGGDIPMGADYHKGSNNQLCLTVEADEIAQCCRGIDLVGFIDNVLIPHLAHQYYHKLTGAYIREYAHYADGIKEYYTELFGTSDSKVWVHFVKTVFTGGKVRRNDLCPCGSGKKFKNCHQAAAEKIKIIGKQQVITDLKRLQIL